MNCFTNNELRHFTVAFILNGEMPLSSLIANHLLGCSFCRNRFKEFYNILENTVKGVQDPMPVDSFLDLFHEKNSHVEDINFRLRIFN
jgi:hypothetical protein